MAKATKSMLKCRDTSKWLTNKAIVELIVGTNAHIAMVAGKMSMASPAFTVEVAEFVN